MATPVKTIPDIPTTTVVVNTDEFLVKQPNTEKPDMATWGTMLSATLSALPISYYGG